MSIPVLPTSFSPIPAPFVPVGKQSVAEQQRETKPTSSLKAINESAEAERSQNHNRREESITDEEDSPEVLAKQARKDQQQAELAQDQQEIRELAARDREVRRHEQTHVAVGGPHAGAAQYTFQRGPDGVNYAVSGEVAIDTSAVPGDPQATINKARQIRRAALAPAEPSGQDRRVAAEARQMELNAQRELLDARTTESLVSRRGLADLQASDASPGRLIQDTV